LIKTEIEEIMIFVYRCIHSDYKKIKRSREDPQIKNLRLEFYKQKLLKIQELMTKELNIKAEFKEL